jgi:hypothetical protein
VLASPAWIKVSRYLKGHGPDLVQVQTALASVGGVDRFAEDGITPSAGQRWKIYSGSSRSPFATSACAGSAPMSSSGGSGGGGGPAGTFLYVNGTGMRTEVELRSAANGRVVRRLGSFGSSFTNNGAAVSPDRRFAYVTVVDRPAVRIVRIRVADGRRTMIADGAQPAVSPNGRWLAYATSRGDAQTLAVRPTGSGPTRTIVLRRRLGPQPNLLDGTLTWLGDGSGVVVAPGPVLHADVGGSTSSPPPRPAGTCSAVPASATCLIVVSVGSSGRPAQARLVIVPGVPGAHVKLAADPGLPGELVMAVWLGPRTVVDQVALNLGGPAPRVVPLVSMAPVLPLALDPVGGRLLYLAGHSPPALWIGAFEPGHLIARHRLIANAQADAAAW